MAETDTAVQTVKRLGLLDKTRYELAFMVADYVDELNEERTRRHAAEAKASEASTELRSARFRHEQATRCAGCGQRKHTPLTVDEMGGYVCLTCIDKRLIELLTKERDPTTVTLTKVELINLLKVSWRDGNGLREMWQDEWPETMHADVKRTVAEIDRWKAEGVLVDAYPEDARRCPCGESYADCRDWPGATEKECPTYGS